MPAKLAALLLVLLALPSSAAALTNDIGRIAYTSDRDGNSEIYSARVDGYGETNLTNNPATDRGKLRVTLTFRLINGSGVTHTISRSAVIQPER